MEDLRTVMRAVGSSRAVMFGYSEGAPMSLLFAATHPGQVTALILGSASARWFPAPGYPCGQGAQEMFDALEDIAAHRWGQGASIEWYMQGRAGSARMRQAFARFERMAISPSSFLRMSRMIRDIDVRAVLPAIQVPTLVIQRLDDRITPPCHGRYLASHIAGARYFEQPGDHSLRFAASGNSEALYVEIADFLATTAHPGDPGDPGDPADRIDPARRPQTANRSLHPFEVPAQLPVAHVAVRRFPLLYGRVEQVVVHLRSERLERHRRRTQLVDGLYQR